MFHKTKMSYYQYARNKYKIKNDYAFIYSHDSSDLGGNMFYIAKELLNSQIKLVVAVKNRKELPKNLKLLLNEYLKRNIIIVEKDSKKMFRAMAIAKYLFTDVQLSNFYIKREGQIVVQTWHGTPLKNLGYSFVEDVAFTGAQKRSFVFSDYVLFPNEHTMNSMIDSYRLINDLQGKVLLHGYPRNCIFYDVKNAERIRKKLNILDKKVYVYMPTWRGKVSNSTSVNEQLVLLDALNKRLDTNQLVFVKLHRLVSDKIDFSKYTNILCFPEEYETYEFLSIADCLITDYSSVMFDYLCTRKKIILYVYDKLDYMQKQGMCLNIDELPFPQVANVNELIKEMKSVEKEYDDSDSYEMFCKYDGLEATKHLCDMILRDKDTCKVVSIDSSEKKEVLLYGGGLQPNTETIQFVDFLDEMKWDKCVTYCNQDFFANPLRLQVVDFRNNLQSFEYLKFGIGNVTLKLNRLKKKMLHTKKQTISKSVIRKAKRLYLDVFKQQYCGKTFEKLIVFPEDNIEYLLFFVFAPVTNKEFFVNESMLENETICRILEIVKCDGGIVTKLEKVSC